MYTFNYSPEDSMRKAYFEFVSEIIGFSWFDPASIDVDILDEGEEWDKVDGDIGTEEYLTELYHGFAKIKKFRYEFIAEVNVALFTTTTIYECGEVTDRECNVVSFWVHDTYTDKDLVLDLSAIRRLMKYCMGC